MIFYFFLLNSKLMMNKIVNFIQEFYYKELIKAINNNTALIIDFKDIDKFDAEIADNLLQNPDEVIRYFEDAINELDLNTNGIVRVRFKNLPLSREIRIRELRAEHLQKLWCIDATVKAATDVRPEIYSAIFECPACSSKIEVEQSGTTLQKATSCSSCGRHGDMRLVEKKMRDIRFLNVVEPFELTSGEQPGEIMVVLREDLTTPKMQRRSDPGNRLKIVGILRELPKWIRGKLSTRLDMYFDAVYFEPSEVEFEELEITEEDEKRIKELAKDKNIFKKLVASIAPGIYGYDEIKEALVLQMFGGVPHELPDKTRIRENIHILITGDPSVGKTKLLKLVSSIMPKGRYASGKGVSGAGLTATVVRNEALGGWVLEAGAIVLTNHSLLAIDEFDKMSKDDQIAMHEAMSVGTVSIAKASIVATLPANTAVLAAANPKLGRFDVMRSLIDQIDIPETLLARFDLKFALRDMPNKAYDEMLAEHIVSARTTPEIVTPPIESDILRKYIAYARKTITSINLLPEAAEILKKFYVDMRTRYSTSEKGVVSITLRQYEALIRLAEASAKVRLDTNVTVEDAERAIRLMKYSLAQLGYDYETGTIDIDRLESGISTSQRSKMRVVLEIIEELQKELGDVPEEDVKASAEERGITNIDEILERLKESGLIFQPKSGFVRKI